MIKSYRDYLDYLEADRIASKREKTIKNLLFDDILKFQKLMRKLEYLTNCNKSFIFTKLTTIRYFRLSQKLGFTIPINVFGPGLSISHYGTIVVNIGAKVGANCRLHTCVNIGTKGGQNDAAPMVGNNCYIGPGAKLFGPIVLGDNVAIGANAVVNTSFPEGNVTIGGVPARKISEKTSEGLLTKGYKV